MTLHLPPGRRRRSGLAMVAAVVLIGMAGVVFVALTSLVRHDLRRTAQARGEAQLRQLLLAGEAAAARSLDATAPDVQKVALPADLSADGATLSFTPAETTAETRVVSVEAGFAELHASQRLTYQRREGRWTLVRAELSATSGVSSGMHARTD